MEKKNNLKQIFNHRIYRHSKLQKRSFCVCIIYFFDLRAICRHAREADGQSRVEFPDIQKMFVANSRERITEIHNIHFKHNVGDANENMALIPRDCVKIIVNIHASLCIDIFQISVLTFNVFDKVPNPPTKSNLSARAVTSISIAPHDINYYYLYRCVKHKMFR